MNYELKSISPARAFWNSIRISPFFGFLYALLHISILSDPRLHVIYLWQKIAALTIFTLIYSLLISFALTLGALLYNFFAHRFRGISFHIEQE